ncbi:MAG: TRAP transporter TatT component family protein [Gammaproteobacteria bacterium]|nr:TRAP transporter TatT component family protein [Gammaproteobacteria bacterium]
MNTPCTVHLHQYLAVKRLAACIVLPLLLSACSMGQMAVRGTQEILDSGIASMNRETDLQLAREAMPANLKLLEGMLLEDPGNRVLRLYAAEGFYGYSYGFIEMEDGTRAAQLYRRCYTHARQALEQAGLAIDPETTSTEVLEKATARLGKDAVPALFWSASCLGKWVDQNRDNVTGVAGLGVAATLMQRVLELDETFYHGGPHLFFGVYYGGRSPLLGGDFARSDKHFQRAAEINNNKLLLVDMLKAEYLYRQQLNRDAFHRTLSNIIAAGDNLYPEMALANTIARQRAAILLEREGDWF